MKAIVLNFGLLICLSVVNSLFAQRNIESPKVVVIEQKGDSVFCREKEVLLEVLDFEFDSCNFYYNKFILTFQLVNQTTKTFFLNPHFISWYDTNSLRETGSSMEKLEPGGTVLIKLESIPYAKKRMNSPGRILLLSDKKEWTIPMRLKQESSKVIHCQEGQEMRK
ncbi:hypothetical protein [Fluviicola sp.]|uniref:hypothetical protein n=1 Tax=Fluviicola sp. TaxID=1917219 RepID=UPI0031D6B187